jgi:hypothetical protein
MIVRMAVDLGKMLRLHGAVKAAADDGPSRETRYIYERTREQVRSAVASDLHAEFDSIFPSIQDDTTIVTPTRLKEMAGWLDGIIATETLSQRIKADADAKARAEARRVGF